MYQCLKWKSCLLCGCALCIVVSVFKAFPRIRILYLPPEINVGRDMLVQFFTETKSDLMNNISAPCRKSEFQLWQVQQDSCCLCCQEIPLQQRVYYVLSRYIQLLRTGRFCFENWSQPRSFLMDFLVNGSRYWYWKFQSVKCLTLILVFLQWCSEYIILVFWRIGVDNSGETPFSHSLEPHRLISFLSS